MQDRTNVASLPTGLRARLRDALFDAKTSSGRVCSAVLLLIILASVIAVSLESVEPIARRYRAGLHLVEAAIATLFVVEYGMRICVATEPRRYIFSFYGIVDLLTIVPWLLSYFVAGTKYVTTVRALRLLQAFRIFEMSGYVIEANLLLRALQASQKKIAVFLGWILAIVLAIGSLMYVIEGGSNSAFNSIPRSVYWAIVTITTVGYGDIAPTTTLGQLLSATLMILGYGVLAVPTGIVSAELAQTPPAAADPPAKACPQCAASHTDVDAIYCKYCGSKL